MKSHFRWRRMIPQLAAVTSFGWFLFLFVSSQVHDPDDDPFDEPIVWIALTSFVVFGLVSIYMTRLRRCPECGEYSLGEKGNYFVNFLKASWLGDYSHLEVCKNCGFAEWYEGGDSSS